MCTYVGEVEKEKNLNWSFFLELTFYGDFVWRKNVRISIPSG